MYIVKVWHQSDVVIANRAAFLRHLRVVVASNMSFKPDSREGEPGMWQEVDLNEVSVPVCGSAQGPIAGKMLVEVAAYSYEERMRTISRRMQKIGFAAALFLELPRDGVLFTTAASRTEYFDSSLTGLREELRRSHIKRRKGEGT